MIRLAETGDLDTILALTETALVETGKLTEESLALLVAESFRVSVAAPALGFLIALDQDSRIEGVNFRWFKARHARFVYVDRIVVAASARGGGIGRRLYDDLIDAARAARHSVLCAEVNLDPPNPGSDAFHAALGFAAVGQARLADRNRTVRYLEKPL
jgi:predicted GNAT superfamily acetyltransferase